MHSEYMGDSSFRPEEDVWTEVASPLQLNVFSVMSLK